MKLAVVSSAQGDGELVAHLAAEGPILGKSEMVGVGGLATANQARLLRDGFDVVPITNPSQLRQG
jgi:hypothetical protein